MKARIWFLALLVLSGCDANDSATEQGPNFEAEFQTRYVDPYVAGRIDDWMQVFADDAVALHDGLPPLDGKAAIREFGNAVTTNFHIRKLDATMDEVRRKGDWVWTRGQFVADFEAKSDAAPPGVAGERKGKFFLLWEKQDNGRWQVVMDMGNSIQAPPGEQ